ncbi:MAG: methyltransferase [Alphaproteobacteria bacterium]|nr:methyltransferase [Alphaproteobacteria bacterium]MDP6515131.1 methyltransferase [Alphaproteobacteria bacterium]
MRLYQPRRGYRAAIDPVLLAAAVAAGAGEHVLDLGMGVGAAALCLASRIAGVRITGLEVQPELAAIAARNMVSNAVSERVSVVVGDVIAPPAALATGFDHVMANPPYLPRERSTDSARDDAAVVEVSGKLGDWVALALARVRPKGTITFIHRADRLAELLGVLHPRAGDMVVVPLWPRAGASAKRVLVRARAGLRGPLRLAPGLSLHQSDGDYTDAAQDILRDGATFDF